MKIFEPLESLFTPYVLIALNLIIVLALEFTGDGKFFAETGLVHAIAVLFVALIVIRIFTDYAFSDPILKGFLKIQLWFFLFLGFVHIYEYLGTMVLMLNDKVVELSVMASYFLWLVGVLLALEFVFRIYYKKSNLFMRVLFSILIGGIAMLVGANVSSTFSEMLPLWLPDVMLVSIVLFGIAAVFSVRRMIEIMPVFKEYSQYATPAMILLVLSAFSEYSESIEALTAFGIPPTQNLYLSHFLFYPALSLLLIAFGKLKKPRGIYVEEM